MSPQLDNLYTSAVKRQYAFFLVYGSSWKLKFSLRLVRSSVCIVIESRDTRIRSSEARWVRLVCTISQNAVKGATDQLLKELNCWIHLELQSTDVHSQRWLRILREMCTTSEHHACINWHFRCKLMQRIFKYCNSQYTILTHNKELNIFIYRTLYYVITYRSYKVLNMVRFWPISCIQQHKRRRTSCDAWRGLDI